MSQSITPEVSIITAAYNSERYIESTILSVQKQTFGAWELIISDDLSKDGTIALVEKYRKQDNRIRLIKSKQNGGPAVCRNKAIESARGRHIAFLDSDDIWFPDKLERQLEFTRSKSAVFTSGLCTLIRDKEDGTGYEDLGRIVPSPATLTYKRMLRTNYIQSPTAMYDAGAIGKQYMPLIRKRQDYALWLLILRQGHTCHCMQESVAFYRIGRKDSVSGNKLDSIRYNWILYRDIEKLNIAASTLALANHLVRAPLRRRGINV